MTGIPTCGAYRPPGPSNCSDAGAATAPSRSDPPDGTQTSSPNAQPRRRAWYIYPHRNQATMASPTSCPDCTLRLGPARRMQKRSYPCQNNGLRFAASTSIKIISTASSCARTIWRRLSIRPACGYYPIPCSRPSRTLPYASCYILSLRPVRIGQGRRPLTSVHRTSHRCRVSDTRHRLHWPAWYAQCAQIAAASRRRYRILACRQCFCTAGRRTGPGSARPCFGPASIRKPYVHLCGPQDPTRAGQRRRARFDELASTAAIKDDFASGAAH